MVGVKRGYEHGTSARTITPLDASGPPVHSLTERRQNRTRVGGVSDKGGCVLQSPRGECPPSSVSVTRMAWLRLTGQ